MKPPPSPRNWNSHPQAGWQTLAALLLAALPLAAAAPAAFELREAIGREWHHERVVFPLPPGQPLAGQALLGPDGRPVAYQLLPEGVTFMVDLPPYATQQYRFAAGKAAPATDLEISETPQTFRLVNGQTGIEIRKQLGAGQGPLARIRLPSGAWVGDSRLVSDLPVTRYNAGVVSRGPVVAEVVCRAALGTDSTWELRFRLNAGEPTVLVSETSAVRSGQTSFRLDLRRDFEPTHAFYRHSYEDSFRFALTPLATGRVFLLEPWQNWFQSQSQGASVSLCKIGPSGPGRDLLAIGAGQAGLWVDPTLPQAQRQPPNAILTRTTDGALNLDFVLKSGRREWLISTLDATETLKLDGKRHALTPPPMQAVIKHGQFPLDRVKDQVLTWNHAAVAYPRLLVPRAAVERFRKRLSPAAKAAFQKRIPEVIAQPIDRYNLDEPIELWCATGDERVARQIIAGAELHLQQALDCFLTQPVPYGSAPHMTPCLGTAMTLTDVALGTGLLTPVQRERMLARAAFVAYAIDRPDYWSPERGYEGLPNMTTVVYGYLAAAASLVSPHPAARKWSAKALDVLSTQLRSWSDAGGGWLEAPHYAGVSYDVILGALVMANNAGLSDALFTEPKVKAVATWLGKISTPPDSRVGGIRHLPHLGHTYLFEPTGHFGTLAYLFREQDPAFAARMQWMWQQQGSFRQPGIASSYPTMAGYRNVMNDAAIPATPPAWESEWFPDTGVILRSGFPGPRETQLYLIAGAHRSHYNDDSGAITLWGKGRIVADMFGYCGAAPARDHSLVETPRRQNVMRVEAFATTAALDAVTGLAGGWRRQLAFVKDPDPLGPNYFVLCDSFDQPTPATWRLWTTADQVLLGEKAAGASARIVGREDVATDVFFARPAAPVLNIETQTRQAGAGMSRDFSFAPMASTQHALCLQADRSEAITAVLYPRLKTETAPEFTPLADGRGVKVRHAAGTDYVFVSPARMTFSEDGIAFEGTIGAVLLRGGRTTLALGAAGTIAARGQRLTGPAAAQSWPAR